MENVAMPQIKGFEVSNNIRFGFDVKIQGQKGSMRLSTNELILFTECGMGTYYSGEGMERGIEMAQKWGNKVLKFIAQNSPTPFLRAYKEIEAENKAKVEADKAKARDGGYPYGARFYTHEQAIELIKSGEFWLGYYDTVQPLILPNGKPAGVFTQPTPEQILSRGEIGSEVATNQCRTSCSLRRTTLSVLIKCKAGFYVSYR